MAQRKYPPRDDEGLLAAGKQFEENVGDPTLIGLTAADITRLATANSEGDTAFEAHKTLQIQAKTATGTKDAKLDTLGDILSELNGRVQSHPNMTDERRNKLGIPIYDSVKSKAPAPTEMPFVSIDTATPLQHVIAFSASEGKRGKPEGVREIEIYQKIGGDATANQVDYIYRGRDTDPPYTWSFTAAEAGKQAHYMFRWLNAAGEPGPWKMMSATITSELQSSGD